MEPSPITLIKYTCNVKSDEDFVKPELCRYSTPSMLEIYVFKMSLFDHGDSEEFLLFFCNFNMTLAGTGTLDT